jgi:SAM-dependent methyltransferase
MLTARKKEKKMCNASVEMPKVSPLVRRFAERIASTAGNLPILDVACGTGRNAIVFYELGCRIICVDKDLTRFSFENFHANSGGIPQLGLGQFDLLRDPWPFIRGSVGAIINVHFVDSRLFAVFAEALVPRGYILLETPPGCGGNYLELPKAGAIRSAFERQFDFDFYKEHRIGPSNYDAVTVKMVARKRDTQKRAVSKASMS